MSFHPNRHALIIGVSSPTSIGWTAAQAFMARGAHVTITCREDKLERVQKFAEKAGASIALYDALKDNDASRLASEIIRNFEKAEPTDILFCPAFTDPTEMKQPFSHMSWENYSKTMRSSDFAFREIVREFGSRVGGVSFAAMSFIGAERVVPGYGNMGVAKAALERTAKELAVEYGSEAWRVNIIRCHPVKTIAGSQVPNHHAIGAYARATAVNGNLVPKDIIAENIVTMMSLTGVTGHIFEIDNGSSLMHGTLSHS